LVTTSESAIENGPGPQERASSPGGGRNSAMTDFGRPSHGLSAMSRHTIMVMVPPGFSAVRMLRKAATGFSKNCVPKREKQKSNSGRKG
jgi:hypothetical protein